MARGRPCCMSDVLANSMFSQFAIFVRTECRGYRARLEIEGHTDLQPPRIHRIGKNTDLEASRRSRINTTSALKDLWSHLAYKPGGLDPWSRR